MISLFMKNHSIIDLHSQKDLNKIKKKDVEFYRVPINSNDFNENAFIFLKNTKLLFDFEYSYVDAQIGSFEGPVEESVAVEQTHELPRLYRRFAGLSGLEEMISYIFSFKRLMMVNNSLYDTDSYDALSHVSDIGFLIFDIDIAIKYSSKNNPIHILKNRYECDGEVKLNGLQYSILVLDDFLQLLNTFSKYSSVDGLMRSHGNEPLIRVSSIYTGDSLLPYRLYSNNLDFLTIKNHKWNVGSLKELRDDENYYVTLYISDVCVPINRLIPKVLENAIEMLYYEIYYYNESDGLVLDTDISYSSFSGYVFEKLTFSISSIWYFNLLMDSIVPSSKRKDNMVLGKISITFKDGDSVSLKVNEDSRNVMDTIIELAKYKEKEILWGR